MRSSVSLRSSSGRSGRSIRILALVAFAGMMQTLLFTFGVFVCNLLEIMIHVSNHGHVSSTPFKRNSRARGSLKTPDVEALSLVQIRNVAVITGRTTMSDTTVHVPMFVRDFAKLSGPWTTFQ